MKTEYDSKKQETSTPPQACSMHWLWHVFFLYLNASFEHQIVHKRCWVFVKEQYDTTKQEENNLKVLF